MSVYKQFTLGFKVGDHHLPDPSAYSYTVADLDASGNRDATGLLHRERVGTKRNVELKWSALDWETVQDILQTVDAESFTFTFPCPEARGSYTGTYYVGDRKVGNIMLTGGEWQHYVGELEIHFIEF